MDTISESDKSKEGQRWFNDYSSQTSKEIIFIFQLIIIFIVVLACILNLTFNESGTNLWTVLLSSSIGYILPNPRLNNSRQFSSQRVINQRADNIN